MENFFLFSIFSLMGGVFIFFIAKHQAEEAKRQQAYLGLILEACSKSIVAFESISINLMSAEQLVDFAENEFEDGAFSPFWDSIERAMQWLGAVESNINTIANCSSQYKQAMIPYDGGLPPFPVDPAAANRLAAVRDTSARLQNLVRKAQRNFQFATIYEQRKTNNILIAGFANMGEAISGLGAVLTQSIDYLSSQIEDLSTSMNSTNERMISALGDVSSAIDNVSATIKTADKKAYAATKDQAVRQEKVIRVLDNIQRHRIPDRFSEY